MIYNTSSSTENKHLEIDTKVSLYIKHKDGILQQSTMNKPVLGLCHRWKRSDLAS